MAFKVHGPIIDVVYGAALGALTLMVWERSTTTYATYELTSGRLVSLQLKASKCATLQSEIKAGSTVKTFAQWGEEFTVARVA